jgi:hypothetical protein
MGRAVPRMHSGFVSPHSASAARTPNRSRTMARTSYSTPHPKTRHRMACRRSLAGSARCYGNLFGRAPESHLSVRQRGSRRTSRDGHTAASRAAAPQPRFSCPRGHEPSLYRDRCGVGRRGYAAKLPGCKRDVKTPRREYLEGRCGSVGRGWGSASLRNLRRSPRTSDTDKQRPATSARSSSPERC